MPQFPATTKGARSVWKSPDGQREIFEVVLDYQGNELRAKTYSKDISVAGWTGEVESYEKEGRNGPETFVKQPPKEGGFQSQQGSQAGSTGGRSSKGFSADPFTMYLSYAKDIMVARIGAGLVKDDPSDIIDRVTADGYTLYSRRPDAPEKPTTEEPLPEQPVDTKALDDMFGGTLIAPQEEMPWNKS